MDARISTSYADTNPVVRLRVAIQGEDLLAAREITISGRPAWTLDWLLERGAQGITSIERPAFRLSDYIFKLKKHGLDIETKHEGHGGPFAGSHGRYILQTSVKVLETIRQNDRRKPAGSGDTFKQIGTVVCGGAQ
jgi:hypothetical protein